MDGALKHLVKAGGAGGIPIFKRSEIGKSHALHGGSSIIDKGVLGAEHEFDIGGIADVPSGYARDVGEADAVLEHAPQGISVADVPAR